MQKKYYNVQIQNYLPHREPMLMVDEILEISPEEVSTVFQIKEDNIFLQNGHFSESGITEHIAQTCSSILGQTFFVDENSEKKPLIGFISSIKKLKIYALPKVGTRLVSKAKKISEFGNICTIFCQTYCEDQLIAEAEISMFVKEI